MNNLPTGIKSILVVLLVSISAWAVSAEYYRYKDENGVQVINTYIPPEYVKFGYEVITSSGQVLKKIPPAPTEDELAERDEAKRLDAERRKRAAEQRVIDERLKKLYSHPDDAKRALERKLSELDYQISRKRGQLATLNSKKEDLETYAAEQERSGKKVHEQTVEELERYERQIQDIQNNIDQIEQSKDVIRVEFQRDIDRMTEIYQERGKNKAVQ
ncbi:ABC transporter ATPase [Litoribrevibacter albus]|uniref:DUF4124 domain-containing protein n=1 Tax=Litoribrevibacter albus TaxID=1473156 RepID=A0AA37SCQ0_9GAMM|nr:ABC transporter ATPase [Litoribrevibacter albus]GLQ33024.1 hypothetical protein GCM10007876_35030 [Litoribrevibacter albus]